MKQEYRQLSVPITFADPGHKFFDALTRAKELSEALMAEAFGVATPHQLELVADWREHLNPRWMNGGDE